MEQQQKKPKAKFICDRCGKTFQQKQHLRRHITTIHVGGTKLKCPKCSRQLSRNDNLRRHLMRHEQKARTAMLYTSRHCGGLSELFDTENEDWVPTVHLGRMPKKQGKSKDKKRKTLHKSWVNLDDAEIQDNNHVLVGSMMVSRVIFDESSDSLTLSQYKNLLSFTISVDEEGECDLVPKIDDDENTHLELVLIPKAYLNDSGFRLARKSVSKYDKEIKIEPEDHKHEESAHEGTSNMTSQSKIIPESMEEYAPFHSVIGDIIENLMVQNSDCVSHQRLPTTLAKYNSDGSESDIKPLKLNSNNTCIAESGDSSFQKYTGDSMYIKKEIDDGDEERPEESIDQLQSNSNKYVAPEGSIDDKLESIPSILQINSSKLSVDELFKYID